MNKRFIISVVVMFVMLLGLGFLVHGVLLHQDYSQLPNLFRTEEDHRQHFQYLLLGQFVMAVAFAWVYLQGKERKSFLAQGIRYGLAIAALTVVPKFLIYYSVQPMPGLMVLKQIVFETIGLVLMGIVLARLNK